MSFSRMYNWVFKCWVSHGWKLIKYKKWHVQKSWDVYFQKIRSDAALAKTSLYKENKSNIKMKRKLRFLPTTQIWLVITMPKSLFVENMKWSHGPYGHFGCSSLAKYNRKWGFVTNFYTLLRILRILYYFIIVCSMLY